jgi:uncharacterized protein (TIGR03437 family)
MNTAIRRLAATTSLPFLLMAGLYAQQDRISARIDDTRRVTLRGNVNPFARPEFDQGAVDTSFNLRGMMLVLKQSAAQQSALNQLLEEQRDQASPKYHKWLTPQQYGDQFGTSPSDIAKITAWLKSEGFTVGEVANGRNWIRFSGTAAQVKTSFQTELHRYNVNGEQHFANATEPAIPAALQDIVGGIRGLNDFRPKPRSVPARPESNLGRNHFVVPDDIATIYDIQKLYSAGIDGAGQNIVVVGQTNIRLSDIATFRSKYGLSAPNLKVILDSTLTYDPGFSANDIPEADLDIEWSGGIAKNATILFVYSDNTFDAVLYAINNNLAPVISMSYGFCEQMDLIDLPTFQSWAQQANSQGTTWFTAAGDSGAADCETATNAIAQSGLSVDIPAIVPEVTAVGGTEFDEGGVNYWSASNDANGGSALSYIPEMAWNDSSPPIGLAAGGGGVSTYFAKPAWQTGPGVPNDGFRHIPDIASAASPEHDPFAIYTGGATQYYGGTSLGAPVWAGLTALLNQYLVSTGIETQPGLGNINPTLYRLAQSTTGIFHDITVGGNEVPCAAGSPDCSAGSVGYLATPGYDMATGLGSVDAYNLIHQWSSKPPVASAVVASIDQNPVYQTTPDVNGYQWTYTLTLNEEAGIATTLTGFTIDGTDYSSQIASLFGSAQITADGFLQATLGFKTLANVPRNVVFTFSGVDTGTKTSWSQQLSAPFTTAQLQPDQIVAGVSNAASGQQVYAPGMIMSVYGVQMGLSVVSATATPLPVFIGGIAAYVNGVPAPLYYVSPGQLNVQIPYETQPGGATLEVDTPYQIATTQFQVASTAPGIFVFGDGSITPYNSGVRGGVYTLFITGDGQVAPAVTTGSTPSTTNAIPKPVASVTLRIGGVDATSGILFIGVPSWSVGVTQINFTVPVSVAIGTQQVVVTVGGVASAPTKFNVTQ